MNGLKCAWTVCLGVAGLMGSVPALACYTVLNRANQVVYSAQTPPVDMRYQIHQTLPAVFPGGHLIFGNETDCPLINITPVVMEVAPAGSGLPAGRTGRPGQRPPRAERG